MTVPVTAVGTGSGRPGWDVGFFFLLLLNAVLYIRPGEWILPLQPLHPYEIVIATCLILGFPKVIEQFSGRSLSGNPITVCVIGLFAVTVLADLLRARLETAWEATDELSKVLIYYLLLVGLTDSPRKVRWVLMTLMGCGVVILAVAMLHYYGVVEIPNMNVTVEVNYVDGQDMGVRRLGTTSVLGDPNDCALFIDHCILICVYLVLDGGGPVALRLLWLLPMAFCGFALTLTHSRGGLASLMAGLGAYLVGRYGRKAVLIAAPLVPVLLVLFGGRQSELDLGEGTGQTRVQLWAEYMGFLRGNPLVGVGWKTGPQLVEMMAHNSYLQAFGEQGFLAGTLFVGAYYLAFRSFGRLVSRGGRPVADPQLRGLRPCLLAVVVSQIVGMMALSRNFSLPTYTVLGLTAVYARLAGVDPPLPSGGRLARHVLTAGVAFVIYMAILIRVTVKF